jgi:hypothetical protein
MITFLDCVALCGLNEEEVFAIAEHENIPPMAAAALAQHLLRKTNGCNVICQMIADDIDRASERGHLQHRDELRVTLSHFVDRYPELTHAH